MSITLNRVVDIRKNVVACTYAGKSRIITRGAHPIGKKDIDDIFGRVNPKRCAGEPGMPHHCRRHTGGYLGVFGI